ncbi:Cytochrome P450 2U1 [Dirofilaria immitis]
MWVHVMCAHVCVCVRACVGDCFLMIAGDVSTCLSFRFCALLHEQHQRLNERELQLFLGQKREYTLPSLSSQTLSSYIEFLLLSPLFTLSVYPSIPSHMSSVCTQQCTRSLLPSSQPRPHNRSTIVSRLHVNHEATRVASY